MTTTVEIRGLERLREKTDPALLDAPMRRFLLSAAVVVQSKARERAPVDTGRLTNSISYEVDSGQPPEWAKIGTNVRAKSGALYGRVLDQSERTHYRGGRAKGQASARAVAQGKGRGGLGIGSRMGSKTKGWFSNTPSLVRGQIKDLLETMGREIERAFGR